MTACRYCNWKAAGMSSHIADCTADALQPPNSSVHLCAAAARGCAQPAPPRAPPKSPSAGSESGAAASCRPTSARRCELHVLMRRAHARSGVPPAMISLQCMQQRKVRQHDASRVVVVRVQEAALVVCGREVVAVHHSDRLPPSLVDCCMPRL